MTNITDKRQVSIIIPAYNEEQSVHSTLRDLLMVMRRTKLEFEIIVVDDCSTDNTAEKIKKFSDQNIKLIRQEYNRGYGAALKTGIEQAKYDLIAITDADGTYPADRLPELIGWVGDYDMAVGARNGNNVKIPFFRRLPKMILNKYARYLVRCDIPDINSGLRVFRKDVYKKFKSLIPDGFSFTSTITMAMLSNNYRVKYISIDYYKREGKSKIKPIRDTINFFKLVSRITLYFNPQRVFTPVSAAILSFGVILLIYDAFFTENVSDKTILTLFVGMQFWLIGTLADIIIHQRQL